MSGIAEQSLGELHGGVAGEVAVILLAGHVEAEFGRRIHVSRPGQHAPERLLQRFRFGTMREVLEERGYAERLSAPQL